MMIATLVLITMVLFSTVYLLNSHAQKENTTEITSGHNALAQPEQFTISTNNSMTSTFNIAAAGDWGCGPDVERTVRNIEFHNPQVILALGDLSYEGSIVGHICPHTDQWFKMIHSIENDLKVVIGNHDLDNLVQYEDHFKLCKFFKGLPSCKLFYSFDDHNIHFLVMNSEEKFGKDSEQFSFVVNDLKKAASNPTIKWIIVSYHRSIYAAVDDKDLLFLDNGAYIPLKNNFLNIYHPLFDKYKVDLVLQGHIHDYQRTYPLKFNNETKMAVRASLDENTYKDPEGQIYVTVGTGGVGLNNLPAAYGPAPHTIDPRLSDFFYIAKANDTDYGFLDLVLSSDSSSLDGTFYANNFPNGTIALDHFTISKKLATYK